MILKNKIDFLMVIVAENCNPNADPLMGGRPRQDIEGYGEISDVCIKRKLRNRMQDMGIEILLKSETRSDDGYKSTMKRVQGNKELWEVLSKGCVYRKRFYISVTCNKNWRYRSGCRNIKAVYSHHV